MKEQEESPPKFFLRLFRWYCHPRLAGHIEGDLLEEYARRIRKKGVAIARIKFIIDVLLLCRPGIIRSSMENHPTNHYDMLKNYFVIAWRNLTKSKFYSALNLAGLTLGLAVGLLILLWVADELNYDSFHTNAKNIYRININLESSGKSFAAPVVQPPISYYGLSQLPAIQKAVRLTDCNDYAVFRYGDVTLKDNAAVYTDPSLYKVFDYPLVKGDVNNPFPLTESVILTQSAAKRFFGDVDPMGKVLVGDNKDNFVVSGVMADFPDNSWIKCDILLSTNLVRKHYREWGWRDFDEADWGNYGWVTFLQLQPDANISEIEKQLTQINVSHQPTMKPVDVGFYTLQPLTDIHLYAPDGTSSGMQTVKIFSIVAVLILLIASINYVNLSTARALLRSKEVSIRKITGARRTQLFAQFVVQTLLFFFIAIVLALGSITLLMPVYNTLAGKELHFDLLDVSVWKVIALTLGSTLIISSIYPAMLLSSFNPISALKGKLAGNIRSAAFRRVLVVGQFSFSVGLIIATLIIGRQLSYVQEKQLGYNKSFVFTMSMNNMKDHHEKIRQELSHQSGIEGVTTASNNIVNIQGSTLDVDWDGKDPNGSFFIHSNGVDSDFIPLFQMEIVEGKNFTGTPADSTHFILNETAIRDAGITDPIGKRFRLGGTEGTIVGVVKDFHFVSLHQRIEPFVFYYQPVSSRLFVKANAATSEEAIRAVEKIWKQYNAGFPYDYTFMDETYGRLYQSEQKVSNLFAIFTAIAIVISCLGLLGLSTYTAQMKVKEIGIRKTLGATVSQVSMLLSKDLLTLVLISIVIATPAALYLMNKWLQDFVYKTDLPWWLIALAGIGSLVIAFLTISFQSIKAALENPVKSLRSE